ncbi:FAD-binding oxidoreductase [Herbiconiux sp. KACC 21604]|uniref:FAD-binding oxidoreductase n=1 Tax=unclassified Herbiconiux TaxID=2618217 RepID=UPI001490C1B6|nr:FAD-binding oxidoreductase [Herbiconiux sp. SALV-R1]QJU53954.1 FAD-binding oxidoreductase [Herbiconiux sp. SALV-R1]WPO84982.1 FAD-binding oxidoreductase [Herbiconiux sp. KACC 21604]
MGQHGGEQGADDARSGEHQGQEAPPPAREHGAATNTSVASGAVTATTTSAPRPRQRQRVTRPAGLLRGDEGFEAAVVEGVFNVVAAATGEPLRLPEAIVFPQTEADVVEIVRAARETGQRIAVRSGGHSWVASTVRGDGVLVDLEAFDGVELDAPARRATVGAGVRGGDLSPRLVQAGVAFPVGHCGRPAVGGFLLGGGLGVNWGHWKPACFSIRSLRVVTADGEAVTASATENEELFWLARGSGPGFPGVVTAFELELQPLPGAIRVSTWSFPLSDLEAVTAWITDASPALPTNVEVSLVTAGAERPGGLGADDPHPLVVGVAATVFAADDGEAKRALAPLGDGPAAGVEVLDHAAFLDVPLDQLHVPVDATYPEGARYLADTFWFSGDLTAATALLPELMAKAPSGKSYVLAGMPANGRGAELVTPGEAAYGMHDTTSIIVYTVWDDPADDAANRAWLDEVAAALLPTATGHFLSEADIGHRPERVAGSFREEDWPRIQELRRRFDPDGVFHGYPGE